MTGPALAATRPAAAVLPETLAEAIDRLQSGSRGFHFTAPDGGAAFLSHAALRARVRDLARRWAGIGCRPGDRVVLLAEDQAGFVPLFLSAVRAGLVVVPRSPPMPGLAPDRYAAGLARDARIARGTCAVMSAALAGGIAPHLHGLRCVTPEALEAAAPSGTLARPRPGDTALVQFTSGSSGAAKAVMLSHRNLIANARAIVAALGIDAGRDVGVSWLPLHHDMGLIGFLVTPVLVEGTNWYMAPRDFAARPLRWLELLARARGTVSFAPTFGYDHAARRIRAADVAGLDLGRWRVAGCGGEPILPGPLERFADLAAPAGFRRGAFTPCYGLAEATLAVTIAAPGRGLEICGDGAVCCGRPVAGTELRVTGPEGAVLPDGEAGEIELRGPSVAASVEGDAGADGSDRGQGWRATGDIGTIRDGALYVGGRLREMIILNGQNLFPQQIEEAVRGVAGVARDNAVAFGRPGARGEEIVLAVEARRGTDGADLRRRLREAVRLGLGLGLADVVLVGRGAISRTTSGKLRRVDLRRRYLEGRL